MKIWKAMLILSIACASASAAAADPLNVATARGTIATVETDCPACGPLQGHGCYVTLATEGESLTIGLSAEIGDCSVLAVDDCIEVTGRVTNDLVGEGFSFSRLNIIADIWAQSNYCAE